MAACFACATGVLRPRREFGRELFARAIGVTAQLHDCSRCGHKAFLPEFPSAKLAQVYATSYTTEHERAEYGRHYANPAEPYVQFADRVATLAREFGLAPGARIHEFGCGAGITVHLLRRMGFNATGSDWSAGAIKFARENGNDFIRREDMTTLAGWGEPVDMVLNLHAIEHVPRPVDVLRDFARLLGPRSLLYLNTNQGDSITNRRHGMHFDSWYYFPQHLHYFSPRSFEKIAERAGLKPLLIGTTDRWFAQIDQALPRVPGDTQADRLARVTRDMANQEMEMLCALATSPIDPRPFKTPDPEPPETEPPFDHDSHADYFRADSPWSYWATPPDEPEAAAPMLFSEADGYDYWYYAPAFLGDHWMMQNGAERWPTLRFTAPRDGVALIEVRAAKRYVELSDIKVVLESDRLRTSKVIRGLAPETLTAEIEMDAGEYFDVFMQSIKETAPIRFILMAGVRWLD